MKLVITVVGKDQVGIIAKVSNILADNDVNILDISQTILQDKFTMMMYVEMNEQKINITDLKKAFEPMEENMKLAIQIYAEEIFNSIASGIGAGLAIAATVLLVLRAIFYSPADMKAFYVTGVSVFGGTLILMYLISTLYHALAPIGAKKVFAILDHCSVYIFVAGTYTPFCLGAFNGVQGWILFGIIWALAIIGVTLYAVYGSHMRIASAITYFFMGWMVIFLIKPISAVLPNLSLLFLILGGVVYTAGIFFYSMKSMKWFHSIWHLFVIAGSILHFFAVFFSI